MKKFIYKYLLAIVAWSFLPGPAAAAAGDLTSPLKLLVRQSVFYSPQVMDLMRYDSHAAVQPNIGCVTPVIDLVHYRDRDFDFPVSVSYNSSGFRPRDADNYVGRDWMLTAGGVVYRQVNGIPDDVKTYRGDPSHLYAYTGFLQQLGKNTYNVNTMKWDVAVNPYNYAHLKDFNSSMLTLPSTDGGSSVECSPDVFYFSFGKHSGKFMMNYDGTVSVVGYDGGKYRVDLSGMKLLSNTTPQDTYIRIMTDDGYTYTFGGGGYAALEYNALSWTTDYNFTPSTGRGIHEITAFHLTQIKAPNGRELNIRYRDVDSKYHVNPQTNLVTLNQQGRYESQTELLTQYQLLGRRTIATPYGVGAMNSTTGATSPMYTEANVSPVYSLHKIALIDRIETDGCTINFTYSVRSQQPFPVTNDSKQFFISCGAKLDKVRMTYNGSVQSAGLTYGYGLGSRMFLKSVNTFGEGTFSMSYNFPYLTDTPNPLTCNIDHWGFWRGENSNVALIPGMAYPSGQYSLDYKTTTNHRDATGKNYDTGLLRQMTYPTGGRVEFTYEPHRYSTTVQQNGSASSYPSDYSLSPSVSGLAGGARIRSICYKDAGGSVQKETVYTYGTQGNEGKVMYMPFYRHLLVQKVEGSPDYVRVQGVAFNSEGFADRPYTGPHIRYPEVTEHYIDPIKGGMEQKHASKKMEFRTVPGSTVSYYNTNEYFQVLQTSGDSHLYTLLPDDYVPHLKHLVAHPTDDISLYMGKISRESYYDDNDVLRRKVDYSYAFLNGDNYNLCLYSPHMNSRYMFNVYGHIGREYFRMFLPTGMKITDYYGNRGEQQRMQWEGMKYDGWGYLKEYSLPKNAADSLVAVYRFKEYDTPRGFEVLPDMERLYQASAGVRKLLGCRSAEYRGQPDLTGQNRNVLWKESQFDENNTLTDRVEYPHYDKYGNPVEAVRNGTEHLVFLWSHYGQNLRARIENATYEAVKSALGKAPEDLSTSTTDASALDNVRGLLPAARVYSYWAAHGNDVTNSKEVNGRSTYYIYGTSGRLGQVYRHDENGKTEVLQVNDYHVVND